MGVRLDSRRRVTGAVAGVALPALVAGIVWFWLGSSEGQEPAPGPTPTPSTSPDPVPVSDGPCDWVESGAGVPDGYSPGAKVVEGDIDGDRAVDRAEVLADEARPEECRFVLRVQTGAGSELVTPISPLEWPGTAPEPLMVAEIDGRTGVEVVLDLSPAAVYRPGAVFTVGDGGLERLELRGARPAELVPLDDEFPAGVDCTAEGGTIVVTWGTFADGGNDDGRWEITRTTYLAHGASLEPVGTESYVVDMGSESERWPELGGEPFRSCSFVSGASDRTDASA